MSAVTSLAPRLRPMEMADLAAVVAVEQAAYEFPWTRAVFRDCVRVGYQCFVYQASAGLLGHGVMSVGGGECHILNVCIHPEYQRQGLGRALVGYLLSIASQRRAQTALLEVRVSNTSAYQLYSRMGFNEVGTRKGYYPARFGREDATILAYDLTQPAR